ncbi:ABC transporter ATP-binding protein [Flavihumibacter stibioxidans]|uniref:ABC transporter ATP-binding protein n=1 Tax=Flavihumibacter stibioxidans TaxID=1834163 RepID=A0ABR7M6X3_9BACT|nr:ABC transporter ATP-binding protein [Flavihumibacter stibioxidans]MBC6490732.1 ABC transporter ATP-binding protein [Flavihumibacter stibioxidans]
MDVLRLDNISKSYGKVKALQGVSLTVPEGTVFGILGPNGSGKTTLLSIILDVLAADSGRYLWFGQPPSKEQRKRIGSLLETPNFYHYLSAVNNLKITSSISGRGDVQDIAHTLRSVNLYERRNSRFSTYSLGMKQRLAIAAALLGAPRVLVLDEPTNGLDPVGIAEIRELIKTLNKQGHTIIMASHLLDEVEKICTHVAILKTGKIITTGPVDEVLADEELVELSADNNADLQTLLQSYPGVISYRPEGKLLVLHCEKGTADPGGINRYCFEHGLTLQHIALRKKRLETRFFELTSN